MVTVCHHLFQKQLKKLTFQDNNKILWILLSDFILDVQLTCRTGNAFLAVVVPVRLVCLGLAFGCKTEIEIIILPKIKVNLNFIKIVSGRKCCLWQERTSGFRPQRGAGGRWPCVCSDCGLGQKGLPDSMKRLFILSPELRCLSSY